MLVSCPWGPATAHGVGILTELYAIFMDRYTLVPKFKDLDPTVLAGEGVSHGQISVDVTIIRYDA